MRLLLNGSSSVFRCRSHTDPACQTTAGSRCRWQWDRNTLGAGQSPRATPLARYCVGDVARKRGGGPRHARSIQSKGPDLEHAYGYPMAPILDGWIGCIMIQPDGSRYVGRAVPNPLSQR
jgi:hypothetical protein